MRRRWWKRINELHIYIACKVYFCVMGFYGFYLGIHAGNIGEGFIEAAEATAELAWLVGVGCIIIGYIGIGACRELEKEYNQKQREEERRMLRRCA